MGVFLKKIWDKLGVWSSLHYCFLDVMTCADFCKRFQQEYKVLKDAREVPVTPVRYWGETPRLDVTGILPESYIAVLNDAAVIGSSNAVICGGKIIYDMLVNKKDTYYITDKGLFQAHNAVIHIGNRYFACFAEEGEDIDEAICLVGNFSRNLYHFVLEILAKWYLIEQAGIMKDVPVLVDVSARDIPQFRDLLSIFLNDRDVIYVEEWQLRKVRKLYYPSLVNKLPPNLKTMESLVSEDIVFDMDAIRYLKRKFLDYMGEDEAITPKEFFISRKNTTRRCYNEEEVIKVAVNKGFEVVSPETLTIKEQFKLFYSAEQILAASGAALTNILCCRPGTKVLVLVSVRLDGTFFSTIAKGLGIQLHYLVGDITNYKNVQSDFIIDCSILERVLSEQ